MTLTRRDLEREAKKHGAWIESDTVGNNIRLQCVAPAGHRWAEDPHMLVCDWLKGDEAWKDDAIRDAISRMSHGIVSCDCQDCLDEMLRLTGGEAIYTNEPDLE